METVESISKGISSVLWACTADITDAFHQVPLQWQVHKFFAFIIGKGPTLRVFVFQFLPFGLSIAPWAFNRVMNPIKKHIREFLIILHTYLDDFMIMAETPALLEAASYRE